MLMEGRAEGQEWPSRYEGDDSNDGRWRIAKKWEEDGREERREMGREKRRREMKVKK